MAAQHTEQKRESQLKIHKDLLTFAAGSSSRLEDTDATIDAFEGETHSEGGQLYRIPFLVVVLFPESSSRRYTSMDLDSLPIISFR